MSCFLNMTLALLTTIMQNITVCVYAPKTWREDLDSRVFPFHLLKKKKKTRTLTMVSVALTGSDLLLHLRVDSVSATTDETWLMTWSEQTGETFACQLSVHLLHTVTYNYENHFKFLICLWGVPGVYWLFGFGQLVRQNKKFKVVSWGFGKLWWTFSTIFCNFSDQISQLSWENNCQSH